MTDIFQHRGQRDASSSAAASATASTAAGAAASTSDHVAETSGEEKLLHKCE